MTSQLVQLDYQTAIEQFCERVKDALQPDCIILHGSMARGTATPDSDIDILVIGGRLADNFFERLFVLGHLSRGAGPVEAIGYTRDEWEKMMKNHHLTVLEALEWGIPLHGQEVFAIWKTELEFWKEQGLRRGKTSWSVPPALLQREAA